MYIDQTITEFRLIIIGATFAIIACLAIIVIMIIKFKIITPIQQLTDYINSSNRSETAEAEKNFIDFKFK